MFLLVVESDADPSEYLSRVVEDDRVDGMRIVIDLHRYRYYGAAIIHIAKYTPKSWIYLHAKELKTIFDLTRGAINGQAAQPHPNGTVEGHNPLGKALPPSMLDGLLRGRIEGRGRVGDRRLFEQGNGNARALCQ